MSKVRGLRYDDGCETRKDVVKTDGYYVYYKDKEEPVLDITCGYGAFVLGYNNKELFERIHSNYDVAFLRGVANETTEQEEELNDIILDYGNWEGVSWAVSGSDAVEAMMAMVDKYYELIEGGERRKILTLFPCYVGTTMFGKHVRHKYEYWDRIVEVDAPMWLTYDQQESEEARVLADLRTKLEEDKAKKNPEIGSLLMESSPWLDDMVPWSPNFWSEIRKLCDEFDILWAVDDVAVCWGKFGTWFGWQQFGVQPDVSSIGKALTAGYTPFGAAVCNKKVFDVLSTESWDHAHTWHPNMWGVTAAIQTTKLIEHHNYLANVPENNAKIMNIANEFKLTARGSNSMVCIDLPMALNAQDFWNFGLATGLPIQARQTPGQLKIVAPLIADDEYFEVLYDRVEKMFKNYKIGTFGSE